MGYCLFANLLLDNLHVFIPTPYFTSGVYVSQKSILPDVKPEDKPAVQSEKSAEPAAPTSAAVPAEADDEPVPSAEPGMSYYT